ncbi:YdcF family protein [Calidifontimicrobium sp. SYSU G02091]|uniref:YdcF family protein n=1 Tax=Calidifontimicrobium sp. SYSU G02091 TaxID=2926421 RepID=UPI001F53A74B|nr:YdcF family protein [Calidifontimicrobium sp. SYSU G02091]MCI1190346.1 YdcF family protein [Calidifontimicrobium sp. SYSU G02091]
MNESLSLTYLVGGVVVPPVSLVLLALLGLWIARRRRAVVGAIGGAIAAAALAGLLALSLPMVAFALMTRLEGPAAPDPRTAARDAGAIVILGGGVARGAVEWGGDTVGVFTLQRLRYGAHLAKALGLPVLITGAAPADDRPGEAAMMRDVLEREFGVDVRWFDERARTTAGNAREAAALLRAAGVERVVLVTHAFHMGRARGAFERAGLQVVPAPTGYMGYAGGAFEAAHLVPNGDALRVSYVALREMAARLLYRVVDRQ